ncbi:MAG: 4-hydroxy-3-methylbut-2-enyl diphosphate reductase [Parasporobacterium sp.]|nr:4-hydroxy-3-methylbut-2-enyl diphosphate reductase [Parasporobacterium sp.]
MEIKLAESAGFCFGVKRAVNAVYEQIEKHPDKHIYTYGPIIHNREVVCDLEKKGVFSVESPGEILNPEESILIIRSHGVAKEVFEKASQTGTEIVDATCPFVKKIHTVVSEKGREGYHVVIVGDKDHPEVKGIVGWAEGPITVINSEEEAEAFSCPGNTRICIVAQTTSNVEKFNKFVEIVTKKGYHTVVINTICHATQTRQKEAGDIAKHSESMIVIGDKHSSNSRKLFEICKSYCTDTYYIQTVEDLPGCGLEAKSCVGITAGASTPDYIIQEVLLYVRGNDFQ